MDIHPRHNEPLSSRRVTASAVPAHTTLRAPRIFFTESLNATYIFHWPGTGRAEPSSVARHLLFHWPGIGRAEPDPVAHRQKARFLPAAIVHQPGMAGLFNRYNIFPRRSRATQQQRHFPLSAPIGRNGPRFVGPAN